MRIPPSIQWVIDRIFPPDALLLSDDAQIIAYVTEALSGSRYRLRRAFDRSQALAEVERLMPRIVILDLGMPEAASLRALQGLRRVHPYAGILGLMGPTADSRIQRAATQLGIDCVLALPTGGRALLAQMDRLTRRPRGG